MAFDIGINLRGSSSYVTDGANETYAISGDSYPTTRGGFTFGYEDSWDFWLDRNSSNDRRIAGCVAHAASGVRFRVDLPASGDVQIHLAIGDAAAGHNQHFDTKDGTTTLDSYDVTGLAADTYIDAAGSQYSAANWPGNEVAVTRTFSTTIFRMQINANVDSYATFAHVRLVQEDAGGGVFTKLVGSRFRLAGNGGGLVG